MGTNVITGGVWRTITRAARALQRLGMAAVAHFGAGGARLLPVRNGSSVLVDTSDAVARLDSGRSSENA